MHTVFLGVGGNVGNKPANSEKVYKLIENEIGSVTNHSSIYESEPWGFESDDLFWNQVLMVKARLQPEEILDKIATIESYFGRKRTGKGYTSREMDIDILYFDELILNTETLTIPHPQIQNRLFVLVPLAEIAPEYIHPLTQMTSLQMLENCTDTSEIKKIEL